MSAITIFLECLFAFTLILSSSFSTNKFHGTATSYGIHIEANGLSTKLRYDLPSARVRASPSKDWEVTNNNAFMTSFQTPIAMTLYETHPKFDMKGTWPKYKVKIGKAQKPKKRLLRPQSKILRHQSKFSRQRSKLLRRKSRLLRQQSKHKSTKVRHTGRIKKLKNENINRLLAVHSRRLEKLKKTGEGDIRDIMFKE